MSEASNRGLDSIRAKLHHNRTAGTDMIETPPEIPDNFAELEPTENVDSPTGSVEVTEEKKIQLLEERLRVNHSKRKLGEVIIRKEIETRLIEVPVRREKLIIERVGAEPNRLAEVDLGEVELSEIEVRDRANAGRPVISAEFTSVQKASKILSAIAGLPRHGCTQVRIELVLEDEQLLETYQNWLNSD